MLLLASDCSCKIPPVSTHSPPTKAVITPYCSAVVAKMSRMVVQVGNKTESADLFSLHERKLVADLVACYCSWAAVCFMESDADGSFRRPELVQHI